VFLVVVVLPEVVVMIYSIGVWGIGFEVRKKPSLLWRVVLAHWLISVVHMEVMVV
jgi:hypothetical protein